MDPGVNVIKLFLRDKNKLECLYKEPLVKVRSNTVDLLFKKPFCQKEKNIFSVIKAKSSYKEVKHTDSSRSVRIPWFVPSEVFKSVF
jgi:hypothetical protein